MKDEIKTGDPFKRKLLDWLGVFFDLCKCQKGEKWKHSDKISVCTDCGGFQ